MNRDPEVLLFLRQKNMRCQTAKFWCCSNQTVSSPSNSPGIPGNTLHSDSWIGGWGTAWITGGSLKQAQSGKNCSWSRPSGSQEAAKPYSIPAFLCNPVISDWPEITEHCSFKSALMLSLSLVHKIFSSVSTCFNVQSPKGTAVQSTVGGFRWSHGHRMPTCSDAKGFRAFDF